MDSLVVLCIGGVLLLGAAPRTHAQTSQNATLRAPNTNSEDQFGAAVAVDGDRAIVGAPLEDGESNTKNNAGAAYIFERDGSGAWQATDTLRASNVGSGDQFGGSVSISGDQVVVGARLEDGPSDGKTDAGAAYVFKRNGSGWPETETELLRASNAGSSDRFGTSVSVDRDTVIVGAPDEDGPSDGRNDAGSAYVFERDGGTWSETQILQASNAGSNDKFGSSVSVQGPRAAVGARLEDGPSNGRTDAGAVYVFERDDTGWPATETALLRSSNAASSDQFGSTVSTSSDSLVVGAPFEDGPSDSIENGGAGYVFGRGNSGSWTETQVLRASSAETDDRFGNAVAIDGGLVTVGARLEDGPSDYKSNAGAAYIFVRGGTGWPSTEDMIFRPTNANSGDQFGSSIGINGGRLIAGAPNEDGESNSRTNAGAAYVNNSLYTPTLLDNHVRTLEGTPDTTQTLSNDSPGLGTLDSSSVQLETMPSHGTATANADGTITYDPNDGFTGADSYTYSVANENGNRSSAATVTITVLTDGYGAGRAIVLDGSGDYIEVPDDPAINTDGPYEARTIELWFRATDLSASTEQVLFEEGGDGAGFNVYLESGALYAGAWDENNGWSGTWLSTTAVQSGTWHHVALVFDQPDGVLRAYLDGAQFGGSSPGSAIGDHLADVAIGASFENTKFSGSGDFTGTGRYFEGRVDQVRLWNGALTKTQVRAREKRTIGRSAPAADSLIADYRVDTGSGSTAFDYATDNGGAQDGTLAGDPRWAEFSGAQFGDVSTARTSGSATLGPSGGTVTAENVSTSGSDALQVYQYGRTDGPALSSSDPAEDFSQISDDVAKRLNIVWGLDAVGSSPSADVTFDYSNVQGLSDPANVRLLKRGGPGQPWQDVSDSWTWNSSAQTFSKSGITSFSQYAVGEASSALPVEMASFEATRIEKGIRLAWKTASEQNNAGFRVQRKTTAAAEWATIGRREGAGTTSDPQTYHLTDANLPYTADSLSYRLKQVDLDGSTHFTDAITVRREGVQQAALQETYPNPARGAVTVRFAVPRDADGEARLTLYDVLGREVRTVAAGEMKGRQTRRFDVSGLSSGVYVLRLAADGTTRTRRLTVVK